eukprot:CAMPEP_0115634482 /NCGR_PEP_ID=MMETSP0272-20121206/32607_1 /TAXON_ID=71861 /ORGANISM="Scrippsiella trochoidea, Strain CCMP3099" /LENGTH=143 /DNA_ID=CAMNT_0003071319 /DNA_START=274 /DNA_END=701 /DNA_ORIENTATION=-
MALPGEAACQANSTAKPTLAELKLRSLSEELCHGVTDMSGPTTSQPKSNLSGCPAWGVAAANSGTSRQSNAGWSSCVGPATMTACPSRLCAEDVYLPSIAPKACRAMGSAAKSARQASCEQESPWAIGSVWNWLYLITRCMSA